MNVVSFDPGLSCTGVFSFKDGAGYSTSIVREKGTEHYAQLALIHRRVLGYSGSMDVALVEDYLYSSSMKITAYSVEVGGVVRAAIAAQGTPIIAVNVFTWKSLTIGDLPKGTVKECARYLEEVEARFGKAFETVDEADAYLIYQAVLRIHTDASIDTKAARRIREELAIVLDKINRRCAT